VFKINNLIRFINKNQKTIFYVILAVIFFIIIIASLNAYYTNKEKEAQEELENNKETESTYSNGANVTMENIEDDVSKNITNDNIENTMKLFVNYCNNGDYESAYNMLTEECKTALAYHSAKAFKDYYIDLRFPEPQEYVLKRWDSEDNIVVCLITFNGDLMASGGADFSENQEYYTFVKQNGEYKINLNNYIYGEERKTKYVFDDIDVKVTKINAYSRYEEITMEITNNSTKDIAFSGYEDDNSVYLTNEKGTIYSSINSEFDEQDVVISAGNTKEVTVTFNKLYSSSNKATTINFGKVILDYDEYLNTHNRSAYKNTTTIKVNYN